MPRLFFGNPFNGGTEDNHLLWWHIQVFIDRKIFWQFDTINNARIYVILDDAEERQMLWRGDLGPVTEINLLYGDSPRNVPVAIRLGLSASPRYPSADPTRLPHFIIDSCQTLLTDVNLLLQQPLKPATIFSGSHSIKFRIRSGADYIDSGVFTLIVPEYKSENGNFSLYAIN